MKTKQQIKGNQEIKLKDQITRKEQGKQQQSQDKKKNRTSYKEEKKNQQQQVKFNRQLILKYIQQQKNQITALRAYFSSRFNEEKNTSQSINFINTEIQNYFLRERSDIQNKKKSQPIIKDKKIVECLKNFGTNQKQSQVCVHNSEMISQNVLKWVQQASKTLSSIQQPLKEVQRKSLKKTLTQKQVDDFKLFLKSQMVLFQHNKDLIMRNYATQIMKGDCQMLSVLSSQIQKYKQWMSQ